MAEENVDKLIADLQKAVKETEKVKPGWKTTEFWLSLLAIGVSLVTALFNPQSTIAQIAGVIGAVLASLGYSASRSSVKNNAKRTSIVPLTELWLTKKSGLSEQVLTALIQVAKEIITDRMKNKQRPTNLSSDDIPDGL